MSYLPYVQNSPRYVRQLDAISNRGPNLVALVSLPSQIGPHAPWNQRWHWKIHGKCHGISIAYLLCYKSCENNSLIQEFHSSYSIVKLKKPPWFRRWPRRFPVSAVSRTACFQVPRFYFVSRLLIRGFLKQTCGCDWECLKPVWWWLEHDWIIFPEILAMSSSHLTFIFFRGVYRYTTNQETHIPQTSRTVSYLVRLEIMINQSVRGLPYFQTTSHWLSTPKNFWI